jgi:hypothetical protein
LLGREVRGRSDDHPLFRELRRRFAGRVRGGLRDPEVQQQDAPVVADHHVVGLHVAVHETMDMRETEGARRPDDPGDQSGGRRGLFLEVAPEARTLDQLHDEVRAPVVALGDVVHVNDAWMVEGRRGLRLAQEALARNGVAESFGRQDLHRDLPPEAAVSRAVHDAHSAGRDALAELVTVREHASLRAGHRAMLQREAHGVKATPPHPAAAPHTTRPARLPLLLVLRRVLNHGDCPRDHRVRHQDRGTFPGARGGKGRSRRQQWRRAAAGRDAVMRP